VWFVKWAGVIALTWWAGGCGRDAGAPGSVSALPV
jgi:hypothetical protein